MENLQSLLDTFEHVVFNTARDAKEFLERAEKLRDLSQPIWS
jgi:hypothetical protein